MSDKKHYPFSCGTQYMDWCERNCVRCAKSSWNCGKPVEETTSEDMTCEIERCVSCDALMGDGSVPEAIAERMGYLDNSPPRAPGFSLTWPCKEFVEAKP